MKTKLGFTLIELLVVISIIGLLSSVVLATVNTARESARITAGLSFSAQIKHSTGDALVAEWIFQKESGDTVEEVSGMNGVIVGGTYAWQDNNPYTGRSLFLDDHTFINLAAHQAVLTDPKNYGGRENGKSTIEAWIKIDRIDAGAYNGSTLVTRMAGVHYFKVVSSLGGRFRAMVYQNSNANFWPVSKGAVQIGKWTHVALVIEAGIGYSYYIDGKLDNKVAVPTLVIHDYGNDSAIGNYVNGGYPNTFFKGNIAMVRIYGRALGVGEIRRNYEDGLKILANK